MSMTQTYSPYEFYEGQGVWFQGCIIPKVNSMKTMNQHGLKDNI